MQTQMAVRVDYLNIYLDSATAILKFPLKTTADSCHKGLSSFIKLSYLSCSEMVKFNIQICCSISCSMRKDKAKLKVC